MGATTRETEARIEQLSAASTRQVVEPDQVVTGEFGRGPLVPPELLSVAGLDLSLRREQVEQLAREELSSVTEAGIRFEAGLMTGFSFDIFTRADVTDPRVAYVLHEMGEETRHSRLFARMIHQLAPAARNPFGHPLVRWLEGRVVPVFIRRPALLLVVVLAGEEITDLWQRRVCEHPDSDPYLVAINRYHRQEEARHLVFNRVILGETWAAARWHDRLAVRHLAPLVIGSIFRTLVHPGVYRAAGLPGWRTWWACNRSRHRVGVLHEAIRPVVAALVEAGVLRAGRLPGGWRRLSGEAGRPARGHA